MTRFGVNKSININNKRKRLFDVAMNYWHYLLLLTDFKKRSIFTVFFHVSNFFKALHQNSSSRALVPRAWTKNRSRTMGDRFKFRFPCNCRPSKSSKSRGGMWLPSSRGGWTRTLSITAPLNSWIWISTLDMFQDAIVGIGNHFRSISTCSTYWFLHIFVVWFTLWWAYLLKNKYKIIALCLYLT